MNKEKGKHKWSLFFLPRSQHKIEMWRNSHHRKRFFCSSCSIMTAWALERSVSYWATPFPVLFSTAWQLIFWLPIHFCLSSDFFFTGCFVALLSFLLAFLDHGGVDSLGRSLSLIMYMRPICFAVRPLWENRVGFQFSWKFLVFQLQWVLRTFWMITHN